VFNLRVCMLQTYFKLLVKSTYTISAIQSIQFLVPAAQSNSIDQSIYCCPNARADGGNEFINFRFYITTVIIILSVLDLTSSRASLDNRSKLIFFIQIGTRQHNHIISNSQTISYILYFLHYDYVYN